MSRMEYYAISADGGNSWTKQWHDYDDFYGYLTDNIGAVAYINKESGNCCMAYVDDKISKDGHGYPIYKGRFGNCLIALGAKRTDRLYLLDKVSSRRMILQKGDTMQDKEKSLSENCKIIIERATTFSHSSR